MPKLNYNLDDLPDSLSVPSGRYRAKLKSCTKAVSKSSGNPMLTWEWKIVTGAAKGMTIRSWTSLQEGALVSLKQTLTAFGLNGKINKSTDGLIGGVVVLVIGERPSTMPGREGESFSNVMQVLPKDTPLKGKLKAAKDLDEDDDDDEAEDEDQDDDGDDEDDDEDEEDDEDLDDDDEDDDEDEEPAPKKRKSSTKSSTKSSAKKKSRR